MDEEKLILEIENHRIIYDPDDAFYKDNYKKEVAWSRVSEVMGFNADLCKAKWRTLRDTYVRCRKKALASGSNQKNWKYNGIMSFISPHVKLRSSNRHVFTKQSEEEKASVLQSLYSSEELLSACVAEQQRASSVSPAPSLSEPTTPGERDRLKRSLSPQEKGPTTKQHQSQRLKSDRSQTPDYEERLLSILHEPLPKPVTELDESYHFALSLVPLLNKMDHHKRQQAKIGILNFLLNIESTTEQH